MKNAIIVLVLVIIILVLYGFNEEYGWINFKWENLAIGVAGGAGSLHYFKSLAYQKKEDTEMEQRRYEYRVLEHKEFIAREKQKTGGKFNQGIERQPQLKKNTEEFFYNEKALG